MVGEVLGLLGLDEVIDEIGQAVEGALGMGVLVSQNFGENREGLMEFFLGFGPPLLVEVQHR